MNPGSVERSPKLQMEATHRLSIPSSFTRWLELGDQDGVTVPLGRHDRQLSAVHRPAESKHSPLGEMCYLANRVAAEGLNDYIRRSAGRSHCGDTASVGIPA
jgi:hypothetical protein